MSPPRGRKQCNLHHVQGNTCATSRTTDALFFIEHSYTLSAIRNPNARPDHRTTLGPPVVRSTSRALRPSADTGTILIADSGASS